MLEIPQLARQERRFLTFDLLPWIDAILQSLQQQRRGQWPEGYFAAAATVAAAAGDGGRTQLTPQLKALNREGAASPRC